MARANVYVVLACLSACDCATEVNVTISYIRRDSNYEDWGLYYWSDSGNSGAWDNPLSYSRIEAGGFDRVATFVVPVNEGAEVNFIIHKGDEKAFNGDATVTASAGVHVWVAHGSSKTHESNDKALNAQAELTIRWVGIGREENTSALYDGWGLHYWTRAGFTDTDWKYPRAPDRIDSINDGKGIRSVAVFSLSIDVDDGAGLCFLVHRGDFKLPNKDLCFDDALETRDLWIGTLPEKFSSLNDLLQASANRQNQLDSISENVDKHDRKHSLEKGWSDSSAFMEIYVRSYKDTDGDGWGDLEGVIGELEYLKALGIKGLWLMPIYPTGQHSHGYDVVDYRNVHPDYGTLDIFDRLVTSAHGQGMAIILDYLMNHASSAHPLFVSSIDVDSKYHDWFVWMQQMSDKESWTSGATFEDTPEDRFDRSSPCKGDAHGARFPWVEVFKDTWFYAIFDAGMPDWNLTNRAVVDFHLDNLKFWLNRGVDGFRFDAASHLVEKGPGHQFNQPENHVIMKEVRELIESYGEGFTVCEAPSAPSDFASKDSCGRSFAFNYVDATVLTAIKQEVNKTFHDFVSSGVSDRMPLFLSNHDCFAGDRAWRRFQGDEVAYRVAAASYLLTSNTPFVYYGEEIGLAQSQEKGDASLRSPMSWTGDAKNAGFTSGTPMALSSNVASHNVRAEASSSTSLLSWYKQLLNARLRCNVFAGKNVVLSSPGSQFLSLTRTVGEKVGVIVINYANEPLEVTVATEVRNGAFVSSLHSQTRPVRSDNEGILKLAIEGRSVTFHTHGCEDVSEIHTDGEDRARPGGLSQPILWAIIIIILLIIGGAILYGIARKKAEDARMLRDLGLMCEEQRRVEMVTAGQ